MATIQIRVDDTLKSDADALFSDLGLDTTTAVRMFLKQAVRQQAIPFAVGREQANSDTLEALAQLRRDVSDGKLKSYTDVNEMMKDLR